MYPLAKIPAGSETSPTPKTTDAPATIFPSTVTGYASP